MTTTHERLVHKIYFFFLRIFFIYITYKIVALLLWIFVYDTFNIPSGSMEPTLVIGDKVLANKLIFGARIYDDLDSAVLSRNPRVTRVRGWRSIERNDILAFNFPLPYSWSKIEFKINHVYCKRCVALPGDHIGVVDGVYKNSKTDAILGDYSSQLHLSLLDQAQVDKIDRTFLKDSLGTGLTIKDFGPIYVPRADDSIKMDSLSYKLYRLIIEYETGKNIEIIKNSLYLNGHRSEFYTFRDNYYFVAGDNVLNSQDSRYWGFLPEKHIIGVVTHVLYSKDKNGKMRWDRFMKRLK